MNKHYSIKKSNYVFQTALGVGMIIAGIYFLFLSSYILGPLLTILGPFVAGLGILNLTKGRDIYLNDDGITFTDFGTIPILWVDITELKFIPDHGLDLITFSVLDNDKYISPPKYPKDFIERYDLLPYTLGFAGFPDKSEIINSINALYKQSRAGQDPQ